MGIDIGGTFTDVVVEVDDTPYSTKVLTTYAAPEDAIVDGIHKVCTAAGIGPGEPRSGLRITPPRKNPKSLNLPGFQSGYRLESPGKLRI